MPASKENVFDVMNDAALASPSPTAQDVLPPLCFRASNAKKSAENDTSLALVCVLSASDAVLVAQVLLPTAQPADLLTSLSLARAFHSVGRDFLMQMALAFHVTRAVRNV